MIKQLVLTIVIYLCMTVAAIASCIVPEGTIVVVFTPQGGKQVKIYKDVEVGIIEKQPSVADLAQLSLKAKEDWTDAVIVKDRNGITLLVHKKDLTKCDDTPLIPHGIPNITEWAI